MRPVTGGGPRPGADPQRTSRFDTDRQAGPAHRWSRWRHLGPDHGRLGGRTHEPGCGVHRGRRNGDRRRGHRVGDAAQPHLVTHSRTLRRRCHRRRPSGLRRRPALRALQLRVDLRGPPDRRLCLPDGRLRAHRYHQHRSERDGQSHGRRTRHFPLSHRPGPPSGGHLWLPGHGGHWTPDGSERDSTLGRYDRGTHGDLPTPYGRTGSG